VAPPRQT